MADNQIDLSMRQGTSHENSGTYINDNAKRLMLELQRHWLSDYKLSREKAMVDITEMLHQNFLTDQQKLRTELLTQFRDELNNTRKEMEDSYRQTLQEELSKLELQHEEELQAIKRKQWCFNCGLEAIYHCCWNTSYCSTRCQELHWPTHRRVCRRRAKK